jgi:hypothetical protein
MGWVVPGRLFTNQHGRSTDPYLVGGWISMVVFDHYYFSSLFTVSVLHNHRIMIFDPSVV